jgi:hypothetical protein
MDRPEAIPPACNRGAWRSSAVSAAAGESRPSATRWVNAPTISEPLANGRKLIGAYGPLRADVTILPVYPPVFERGPPGNPHRRWNGRLQSPNARRADVRPYQ